MADLSLSLADAQCTVLAQLGLSDPTHEITENGEDILITPSSTRATALTRPPGPRDQYVTGSVNNSPFHPGGLTVLHSKEDKQAPSIVPTIATLKQAPGVSRGIREPQLASKSSIEPSPPTDQDIPVLKAKIQKQTMEVSDKRRHISLRFDEVFNNPYLLGMVEEPGVEVTEVLSPEPEPDDTSRKVFTSAQSWAIEDTLVSGIGEFYEAIPEMAMEFPFELDPFQKQAILHLERNECVLVAAHTSAGKTVVAEYAIAMANKHLTRAVYTSPIKTLSNQKFREFQKTFNDVGLITGDVSVNPEASCLIVTTEILRSMLYKGADLIRDIEWVIFDEVHYINDIERGVVWEEVIIMLPEHVNIVMLSATVPNTMEFAEWVGRTKQKQVFVVSTLTRPIPLQHYLWAGKKLSLLVNATSTYQKAGYQKALKCSGGSDSKSKSSRSGGTQSGHWGPLIDHLKKKELLPVVVFSLSKKKCESSVTSLFSLDLNNASAKSDIHLMIEAALKRLQKSDRNLPQIQRIGDMLKRGIGIHHSGLLPIVKELVEMAFSKGLVKVLFATETFAMGVNMPTRTVVFNGLRKFDGVNFRDILPGEYTQMAGRAGRRGLDSFGMVIINCSSELPPEDQLRLMILGKPTKLHSRFRLTYNMILNLLRVEDLRVEDMIKRSFSENNAQKQAPLNQARLNEEKNILSQIEAEVVDIECILDDPRLIQDYYRDYHESSTLNSSLMNYILSKNHIRNRYMEPGRIVSISKGGLFEAPAVLLGYYPKFQYFTTVVKCPPGWTPPESIRIALTSEPVDNFWGPGYWVTTLRARDIVGIVRHSITVDEVAVVLDRREHVVMTLAEKLGKCFNYPSLDLASDLGINDLDFHDRYHEYQRILVSVIDSPCHSCVKLDSHFSSARRKYVAQERVEVLKQTLSDDNLDLCDEYKKRVKALQMLEYVSLENTVMLKGRVACEINTCESLILTEIILDNLLTPLTPQECVALLSTFVFQQRTDDFPVIEPNIAGTLEKVYAIVKKLALQQLASGVDITPEDYRDDNINAGLVAVVYEWAMGTQFNQICQMTSVEEGTIVRCITRLDETCRDVRNAARVIGDPQLYVKMEEASTLIKRDIVFAASLYIQ